jgi:hypothetical protein
VGQDRYLRQPRPGEEPQRVAGQPSWDLARPDEPQRVMGYPIDSIGPTPADIEWFKAWLHPVRMFKRWRRRRRLGPYDDEP